MRPLLLALAALITLSACGAEGPPERHTAPEGLSVAGSLRAGIARTGDAG